MLEGLLDLVDADTPPDGPDGPMAVLERRLAGLLGKEAALFFPSGTMAQQVALRVHAARSGRRGFAAHPLCHLEQWEKQGYNVVHGLWLHRAGDPNTLMTATDLAAIGEPLAAVLWELPQRDLGGLLPEWDDLAEQVAVARAAWRGAPPGRCPPVGGPDILPPSVRGDRRPVRDGLHLALQEPPGHARCRLGR